MTPATRKIRATRDAAFRVLAGMFREVGHPLPAAAAGDAVARLADAGVLAGSQDQAGLKPYVDRALGYLRRSKYASESGRVYAATVELERLLEVLPAEFTGQTDAPPSNPRGPSDEPCPTCDAYVDGCDHCCGVRRADAGQDETAAAIDTVARHYIAKAVRDAKDFDRIVHEDYPELCAVDFDRVGNLAVEVAAGLEDNPAAYEAAYALLAARASDQEPQP